MIGLNIRAPAYAGPMVKIEDLHKKFGHNEVLKGINFEVAPREVLSIIGPSGSGKSTLLHCVNRLQPAHRGFRHLQAVPFLYNPAALRPETEGRFGSHFRSEQYPAERPPLLMPSAYLLYKKKQPLLIL